MYRYEEAINILINKFPELKKVYIENIDDYEGLPYVFYESVFVKFILDKVNSDDDDKLRTIFDFIEDMLVNGDDETKNLIGVAVVESLYYEKSSEIKERLQKYFGELTRKNYEDCFK
ncbi:hypothetical protein N1236_13625 [Acetivibrio thermocellus]|uniref:DUF7674 family protein n=1 Tax=Acetivibrio thermocellus TaxID=1515 RepID=UPI0021ADD659|nr:hypothetical protein [Acetivibrio thermocellus]UWV46589.1 hypothetical protein N1236_13625 [Acetivibrio thermocellus]